MDTPTMQWFDFSEGMEEPDTVVKFLENVPIFLEYIFEDSHFKELLEQDGHRDLFNNAFGEAKIILTESLKIFKERLDNEQGFRLAMTQQLYLVGFTGDSLKLKASLLEKSYRDMENMKQSSSKRFMSFFKNPIVELLRRFLALLNSVFGSLLKIFPGLESIKEIKEVGEHYASIAEVDIEE